MRAVQRIWQLQPVPIVHAPIRHGTTNVILWALQHHIIYWLIIGEWLVDLWHLSVPAHGHWVGWLVADVARCRALAIHRLILVRVRVDLVIESIVVAHLRGATE